MLEKLTNKQEQTLKFIKKYIAKYGYSPSIREICNGMKLRSTATVFVHLKHLQNKGYVRQENNKFRTLEILVDNEYLQKDDSIISIPLLGKITAGNPITAIEIPNNFLNIPANLIPKNKEVFALDVSGDSMINAGIFDNDKIILKKTNIASNGEIVAALTNENEVTLKRFFKEDKKIRLQPENNAMSPIILDNVKILGVAIGLYRKF